MKKLYHSIFFSRKISFSTSIHKKNRIQYNQDLKAAIDKLL